MMQEPLRLIDLYIYRTIGGRRSYLLLKRASEKIYAGQWRMVGGKVRPGEKSWQAALREMREETRLSAELFWAVPMINQFYDASSDRIHHIPAFAARVSPESVPELDDEHSEFEWAGADEAAGRLAWPAQQRIVQGIESILSMDKLIEDWIINEHI